MKTILISAAAGLLLAGCTSMKNGRVSRNANGVPNYGLNDQPETSVAGEGALMHGVYDSRSLPSGQFTGQERTQDVIGQRPTLPRESDARLMDHSAASPIGAGSLGQTGVQPGSSAVRGPDLVDGPVNPHGSASDIYRPAGVGGAPVIESGSGANVQTNNPTIPNKLDQ